MAALHGDKAKVRILENGNVVQVFTVLNWSVREDANVEKRHYAGEAWSKPRKNFMGVSGRLNLDVVNPELFLLIQRINDAGDSGVNVPQIVIAIITNYEDADGGGATTTICTGCQLILEDYSGAGKPDLLQQAISFGAERVRVERV